MLVSFLVIQIQAKLIECIIKELGLLKSQCMSHLMNVIPPLQRKQLLMMMQMESYKKNQEDRQEEQPNKQENASQENQEDRQEEQTNIEQQEGTS